MTQTNSMHKNILVVEDDTSLSEVVHRKLDLCGFKVFTARSAKDADEAVRSHHIDALWLDHYLLGKESGLDFVVGMKSDEKLKHIPIFVVSNTASSEKVGAYIRLGIDKYYVKSDHRLEEIIKDILATLEAKRCPSAEENES